MFSTMYYMNYYTPKQHPTYYYRIRTFVRFMFWYGVVLILLFGAIKVSNSYSDTRPKCEVTTSVDFTWENNTGSPIDLANCRHPQGIVLESDGTWGWYEPDMDK